MGVLCLIEEGEDIRRIFGEYLERSSSLELGRGGATEGEGGL